MAGHHGMVRLGEAVAGQIADGHSQQELEDATLDETREAHLAREEIGRHSKEILRDEVVAASQADERRIGVERRVASDVAAGVPAADDEHALALEFFRLLVAHRVHRFGGELAGVVRQVWIPGIAAAEK
jgi:hypothetical protein